MTGAWLFIAVSVNRNILITGASGNLGQAVVENFISQGDRVIVVLSPGKSSSYAAKPGVIVTETNLTDEQSVGILITKLIAEYGSIDAALLLVGGYAAGSVEDTNGALLRKMYSLNFETAYFTARPLFAQMMTQPGGGRIVLVGARPALQPRDGKGSIAYALSKSLIFKLADFLMLKGHQTMCCLP